MHLRSLPPAASWTHRCPRDDGIWYVGYEITTDADWTTRTVSAVNSTIAGDHQLTLTRSPDGRWTVNGVPRPDLDGCRDVDFESSAVTNTLPVHRIPFSPGAPIAVPAVFVRAGDLSVIRLEQRYTLLGSDARRIVFRYESSTFDFECELTFDASGLVVEYPGIAVRDS